MRAPGSNGIAFATQSFIDELAHAAGKDPLQFRIDLLSNTPIPLPPPPEPAPGAPAGRGGAPGGGFNAGRARGVLELVREKSGWGTGALPKGTGRGVAFHYSHQGYFAAVVEARVDSSNRVKVTKVWMAGDVGSQIINPGNALQQVQGSVIEGFSHAMGWEITIDKGRVQQSNFHDYRVLRIDEVPNIEVHLIASGEAPGGIGETGTTAGPPALGNAIYAATGVRLRRMPIDRTVLATRKPA